MNTISLWPTRRLQQATRITHIEYSDTHCFTVTEDGILTIELDEGLLEELASVPEFIEKTRDQAGTISLNAHNIAVLRRLLSEIE